MALTLTNSIDATQREFEVTGAVTIEPGYRFRLGDELLELQGFVQPRNTVRVVRNLWYVRRGLDLSTAATHAGGTEVKGATDAFVSATSGTTPPDPFADGGPGGPVSASDVTVSPEVAGASDVQAALVAVGAITSPLDIAGCLLWLDASQLAGSDGDHITIWPDLSPSGFDATLPSDGDTIQRVDITGASSGSFELTLNAHTTTAIAWDAGAAGIQAALEALTGVGAGNVTVTEYGFFAQQYFCVFGGALAGTSVATMTETQDTLDVEPIITVIIHGGAVAGPTVQTNIQNALSVADFDQTTEAQYLEFTDAALSLLTGDTGFTAAYVFRGGGYYGDRVAYWSSGTDATIERGGANVESIAISGDDSVDAQDGTATNVITPVNATPPEPDFVVAGGALVLPSKTIIVFTNSLQSAASNAGSSGSTVEVTPALLAQLGNGYTNSVPSPLTGQLAELAVYPGFLLARERRLLLEYLSDKWATP